MNQNGLKKFQDLLRTLFQFDCVDLDFGIYRILNYKRGQVEAFIAERLPQIADQAFAQYATATGEDIAKEAQELKQKIITDWGPDAFNGTGQLKFEVRDKPVGKKYLEVEEKAKASQIADELKTRIYNDLFTFFSRYYDDGDFISKRRYGRHETYAIPYNGEEIALYWANRDQYYVKTGDRFKAYRFKVDDYAIGFELRNVVPEQNGNGGKKRYFVLAQDSPVTWNEEEKALSIAFEYRPLTEVEEKEHGRTEQQKPQNSLSEEAETKILELVADGNLKVALAKTEGTNGASLLSKHLTRFTRKNTADFFIHKDLRGFLCRELDFFIKNEVLLLDELIGGTEENLREHVQRGRVVRQVAEAIIDFLAQVEDFQKKLWEKRKFVVRTEYCLTIDRVPEELWGEVITNKTQIAVWHELYSIDGKVNKSFLKAHPTLGVDTSHFPQDFKWRLLANFDDLDEALDGLLIKSENWQALNLLLEKYREKVRCTYIDPPYNAKTSEILYKNEFKHSSWLTLMANRLKLGAKLACDDGVEIIAIDENEQERLGIILGKLFPTEARTCVTIVHNPSGQQGDNFSYCNDYAYFIYPSPGRFIGMQTRDEAEDKRNFRDVTGEDSLRTAAAYCFYPIFAKEGKIIGFGEVCDDLFHPGEPNKLREDGTIEIYPIDPQGVERKWRYARQTVESIRDELSVKYIKARKIWDIQRTKNRFNYKTVWTGARYSGNNHGTQLLNDILGRKDEYLYPKSLYTVLDCISAGLNEDSTALVLDYFAGSATTAHAVINLNRQDVGKRKYILVEIGDWFESVMLPRIKKVVFCEKWKDGKPAGGEGVSHMLKYQYLEQYEDTLNNLELPRAAEGQKMLELFGDEYLLKYMLDFETQGSASLLNLDRFKDPFAYKLKVQEGDEIVERPADLVETFNYLLGIQVKKMKTFQDNGRLYRAVLGEKNDKQTAIVWRSMIGLEDNDKALTKDKAFVEKTVLPALLGEARLDRLLVNGACFVKEAEAIEPEFKRLLFAPVGV